ncbi:unnamed protein product [Didymodactylos carnosus]|uniref:Xrn1 helical domain-containing protein n=1 Tax=Didymodactylos carnosus TaxID=1234261 RepID=A0A815PWG2_9BILA|nr:unnamed protein product [Didymodactylos carnosus]CAF1454008.1 unnamed protein product [Didymodactylos carnosus]CAF4108074.1 unnamed protein product [Didymodactylos carnosus]CAF4326481.1 unnamed protein product [Didymodactylos carnosus]
MLKDVAGMKSQALQPPINLRPQRSFVSSSVQTSAASKPIQRTDNLSYKNTQTTVLLIPKEKSGKDEETPELVKQLEDNVEEVNDHVRLWQEGWRERYYKNKFNVDKDESDQFRAEVACQYARGLCWVLRYYYHGVPAWDWFYPYHYPPFASDFINLKNVSTVFDSKIKPLKPLEQLMAVCPPQSRQLLPEKWQTLTFDKLSPIIDFYPINFSIDSNGNQYAWQGIAVLPFVDEKRLRHTLESICETLTNHQKKRNKNEDDQLYVHRRNKYSKHFDQLYVDNTNILNIGNAINIQTSLNDGIAGKIWCDKHMLCINGTLKSPLSQANDIEHNQVISVKYRNSK